MVSLLGPNGAGKTTVLRALSGMVDTRGPDRASTAPSLVGKPTVGRSPGAASPTCPRGAARSRALSVEENLRLGAYVRNDGAATREDLHRCYGWFPRLEERRASRRAASAAASSRCSPWRAR